MFNNLKCVSKTIKEYNFINIKCNNKINKYIKTGIFKGDDIYLDPLEVHNESMEVTNYLNSSKNDECVYNRSNVGMNTILINSKYMNIKLINKLFKELKNSEVNYTQRFIYMTSLYNDIFNYGFNLYDFLKIFEIYQKTKDFKYIKICEKILNNINDLAYLIFSYRKPLITYCNGKVKGSSGFLTFLSKYSSSFFHSSYSYNNIKYSLLPYGGISYILANLRGSLGIYFALTNQVIKGTDLIWSGMTKRWMSNKSLELMEITSESQLDISEQDANILIEEHFLKIPEIYTYKEYEEIIHNHFKYKDLITILNKLKESIQSKNEKIKKWANETYQIISSQPPLALHITFEILNILRSYKLELINKANINKELWNKMLINSFKIPKTKEEVSMNELKYTIDEQLFIKSLNIETNAFLNFISYPDILNGISSYLIKDTNYSFKPTYLPNNIYDVKKDIINYFIFYKNNYEYIINERSDISFSSLSALEKYNFNYNFQSGSSYDKLYFLKEKERWNDDYLRKELEEIDKFFI